MERHQYEQLDPHEQAKVFHESPYKERAELLLSSHLPAQLAQSMSPEEFYLMMREMDSDERAEIVCYATSSQLLFLADIECWHQYEIEAGSFVKWLETLLNAGEDRLLLWFDRTDYEMIVSGFKKLLQVLKPDWEYASDELLRSQPYFTLDQYYHIYCKEEDMETVKTVLEIFFVHRRGQYAALLEGIMAELDGEVEERAYSMRGVRLSERGFPDIETAREVYRKITREEFDKYPRKDLFKAKPAATSEYVEDDGTSDYPLLWAKERFFLDDLMLRLNDEPQVLEQVHEEFVWLSNKVIASEGISFASENKIRRSIERVRRFVNIGLEDLTGSDLEKARELVKTRWLESIFRWGLSRLTEVRDLATHLVRDEWKGAKDAFLEFLEAPHDNLFRGILDFVPQTHDTQITDDERQMRDFKTLVELHQARAEIDGIRAICVFLNRAFPKLFGRIAVQHKRDLAIEPMFAVLGTVFAHHVIEGTLSDAPLTEKALAQFLKKGFEPGVTPRALKLALKSAFLEMFFAEDAVRVQTIWQKVFERLEQEFGGLEADKKVDTRYISSVAVKETAKAND